MVKTIHKCEKCNKEFKTKYKLTRHGLRKTSCAPIVEINREDNKIIKARAEGRVCKFCNRTFSTFAVCRNHIKSSCPIAPTGKNGEDGMEILKTYIENQCIAGNTSVAGSHNTTHINSHNTTNHITNIYINDFGKESIDHISAEDLDYLVMKIRARDKHFQKQIDQDNEMALKEAAYILVSDVAKMVWQDHRHPENFNIFQSSEDHILVHQKDGWEAIGLNTKEARKIFKQIYRTVREVVCPDAKKGVLTEGVCKKIADAVWKMSGIPQMIILPTLVGIKKCIEDSKFKTPVDGGFGLSTSDRHMDEMLISAEDIYGPADDHDIMDMF